MSETAYTLRDLKATDVFIMSKIIGAMGVDEFKYVFSPEFIDAAIAGVEGNQDTNVTQAVGFEVFFEIAGIVLNKLPECEKDIYKFISSLSGMTVKQVEELPMNTFFNIIVDIVKKDEFKDFIKVVSRLFK